MKLKFTEACCNTTFEINSNSAELIDKCPICNTPFSIETIQEIMRIKDDLNQYDYISLSEIFGTDELKPLTH